MRNKTISVLATAAFSICVGFAATSSATAAPAMGQMQASEFAGTDRFQYMQGFGGMKRRVTACHNRTSNKTTARLRPKFCYERNLDGPKPYLMVRRACK